MTVFNLQKNQSARITQMDVYGAPQRRLFSLGIVVGAKIKVISFSLFKSAVLISCGAIRLSMRKDFAKLIRVDGCE